MADSKRAYLQAIDRLSKKVEKSYLDAIRRAVKSASVAEIEAGILANDIEGILAAMKITPATFSQLTDEIRRAYITGGIAAQTTVRADFDVNDPATVQSLSTRSSQLVVEIIESQRAAVREALAAGFGRNPRSVALDIVGRISRVTGRRTGGIVGLTGQQSSYVSGARAELEELSSRYFTRTLRDKRFDSAIRRAIADKKPLSKAQIEKVTARYSDRMLKHRGDNIGRTETHRALSQGRNEAVDQAVGRGDIKRENITKEWQTAEDGQVRDSHAYMDGQRVGQNEPFEDGDGNYLMFPGDPSAPVGTTANCRCFVQYSVDYLAEELG